MQQKISPLPLNRKLTEGVLLEFVTNSGLFWLLYFFFVLSTTGLYDYLKSPAHYWLGIVSALQAFILARRTDRPLWYGNLIAPTLYTCVDLFIDGWDFFNEPYHVLYWSYAGCMTLLYLIKYRLPVSSAIGQGIIRTLLLPGLYILVEWENLIKTSFTPWIQEPGHSFILTSSILFGVLLGIATLLNNRLEQALRADAQYLGQVSTWAFDPSLIGKSYKDPSILGLQRTQRTILFMDIRGFTSWSEQHSPAEVVQMLNDYYMCSEEVISSYEGFKIQLEGDEVMTRFRTADAAVQAALALRKEISALLCKYNLGAGIGVHTGDVVEGLVGSQQTRQYGIFGDAVNIAARLQSAARKGEIVISAATYDLLSVKAKDVTVTQDNIQVKGKAALLPIYVLGNGTIPVPGM